MARRGWAALALAVLAGCSGTTVTAVSVGDCFQDPEEGAEEVRSLETVDCAEPHDNEIYALIDLEGGDDAPFPGDEEANTQGEELCLEPFEGFVGLPYQESELLALTIVPSEETWAGGDREVICALYADGEQLEGSAEGSER